MPATLSYYICAALRIWVVIWGTWIRWKSKNDEVSLRTDGKLSNCCKAAKPKEGDSSAKSYDLAVESIGVRKDGARRDNDRDEREKNDMIDDIWLNREYFKDFTNKSGSALLFFFTFARRRSSESAVKVFWRAIRSIMARIRALERSERLRASLGWLIDWYSWLKW